jgi:hypothetical protein
MMSPGCSVIERPMVRMAYSAVFRAKVREFRFSKTWQTLDHSHESSSQKQFTGQSNNKGAILTDRMPQGRVETSRCEHHR